MSLLLKVDIFPKANGKQMLANGRPMNKLNFLIGNFFVTSQEIQENSLKSRKMQ